MDLSSRLRAIVRGGNESSGRGPGNEPATPEGRRELTYEPEGGAYMPPMDISRIGEALGGRTVRTTFGDCLVIDRRYESDRWHGGIRIGDCELPAFECLRVLDPSLQIVRAPEQTDGQLDCSPGGSARTLFIDLETTGLSGGAGTLAFLVGCAYFDLGAFQIRQFLLTSYAAERALLAAVADCFETVGLIVTYNGKTFDVPVMETRWMFHRMEMPLESVPHFDMLHPARRLWKTRGGPGDVADDVGCRLTTLERALFEVRRVGDVAGVEIPRRFFQFMRSGNPRLLEAVLEHNRLDLVSLAAVTARAARLAANGADACRDCGEALALGRVYERAGLFSRAEACYRLAAHAESIEVRAEALYRLGLTYRRDRRFDEAARIWARVLRLTQRRTAQVQPMLSVLQHFAAEALAIHHEHRIRDYAAARELAFFALEETGVSIGRRADGMRHRIARLDRKIATHRDARLFQ